MKPSELFCFKDTKKFAALSFFLSGSYTRMMQINPPDDWLKDRMDTGLTSTHTACRFSVLYHAFPPKPCILCSFVLFFGYLRAQLACLKTFDHP